MFLLVIKNFLLHFARNSLSFYSFINWRVLEYIDIELHFKLIIFSFLWAFNKSNIFFPPCWFTICLRLHSRIIFLYQLSNISTRICYLLRSLTFQFKHLLCCLFLLLLDCRLVLIGDYNFYGLLILLHFICHLPCFSYILFVVRIFRFHCVFILIIYHYQNYLKLIN